jgi:hypothetical protein
LSGGGGTVGAEGEAAGGGSEWVIFSSCGVDCYAKHGASVIVNTRQLLVGQPRVDAAKLSAR